IRNTSEHWRKRRGLQNTASSSRGSSRTVGWDMVMPTRSFCTSKTLTSQEKRYGKIQEKKKTRSNGSNAPVGGRFELGKSLQDMAAGIFTVRASPLLYSS